ncbi:hypothetical protein HZA55_01620 [Candidatus Poribacteria bacterium]|nr:hypothetical protein [Candidatus Poribacteria bacterium]
MKSGRKIKFYHTPYVHFAGSMVTYDTKSKALFSSDIFAAFDRQWKLYADKSYVELAKNFLISYVWGKEPLLYVYKKFKIKIILPQHGGIIKDNINDFINILKQITQGRLLEELNNKPTKKQKKKILDTGNAWLTNWLKIKQSDPKINAIKFIPTGDFLKIIS